MMDAEFDSDTDLVLSQMTTQESSEELEGATNEAEGATPPARDGKPSKLSLANRKKNAIYYDTVNNDVIEVVCIKIVNKILLGLFL